MDSNTPKVNTDLGKVCCVCDEWKENRHFAVRNKDKPHSGSNLQPYCKKCRNVYVESRVYINHFENAAVGGRGGLLR